MTPSPFSEEQKAAMREFAREAKAEAAAGRGGKRAQADREAEVLEKIAAMEPPDRDLAERVHQLVRSTAPELASRLWYGMPAYTKDGSVLCFFQDAKKFKSRYATLGFSDKANLDDGGMWPVAFALKELTPELEARIAALVKQAVS
jgi:uncharacterized protein YdhG (YjbR/CyaY superfamily)